jgi:phospholipid/cholesterol/gamma-HCH transport system substrate-binding protein
MERPPVSSSLIRHLGLKVGLLITVTAALVIAFVLYVLTARGVFEPTQRLTLIADNAEGVTVGMDMTFAGFPVGRVRRISLGADGRARLEVEVARRDARWLRSSSVYTLERSLVGATRLRAFTGDLSDPPLEDGAQRNVLRGDVTEEIPRMVATLRSALENVEQITGVGSGLRASVANLQTFTARLSGEHGALEAVLGDPADAKKVIAALERTNALLADLSRVARASERLVTKAERRVLDKGGLVDETSKAVIEARLLLGEARARLKQVDAILVNVEAVSADARVISGEAKAASTDLATLRAEVDDSVRKLGHLIDELNRKWPLARESEVKLP